MSPALDAETPLPEGLQPDTPRTLEVSPLVRERGSDTPLAGRCASPLANRPGRYCTSPPKRGKTRCRMHGGSSRSGIAHPNFKHGMYSTALAGTPLGAHYQTARANPALVQLTEQIALVDARVFELIAKMTSGESLTAWSRVQAATDRIDTAFQALREAQRTKNVAVMMASLTAIGDATQALREAGTAGESDLATWSAISSQIHLRRKLVDSEGRRRKDAQEMVTKERALALLGAVAGSIARNVPDMRQRQAVVEDMRLLMAGAPRT